MVVVVIAIAFFVSQRDAGQTPARAPGQTLEEPKNCTEGDLKCIGLKVDSSCGNQGYCSFQFLTDKGANCFCEESRTPDSLFCSSIIDKYVCERTDSCSWEGVCLPSITLYCHTMDNAADCAKTSGCIWDQARGYCNPRCIIHTDEQSCNKDGCEWAARCKNKT